MIFKYTPSIQRMVGGHDHFSLTLPEEAVMVSALIIDDGDLSGHRDLHEFVQKVIENKNNKDEYWTEGYVAKVVECNGKKMFKIFFHLTDDYEPYYIDPEEFKRILEVWIREKAEFDKDPDAYKAKLKKNGGVVTIED